MSCGSPTGFSPLPSRSRRPRSTRAGSQGHVRAAERRSGAERAGGRASWRSACASRRPASPTRTKPTPSRCMLAPVPVIAADACLACRRRRRRAAACRRGSPSRSRRARKCGASSAPPCCSIPSRPMRCRAPRTAIRWCSNFPTPVAAGHALGAAAGRRHRQPAARPQRPGAGVRRDAAHNGAGMNASVETTRQASVSRLPSWTELNRQWLVGAIARYASGIEARSCRASRSRWQSTIASRPDRATGFTPALIHCAEALRPLAFRA